VGSDLFKFKQFSVYQDKTAMKVGTDGVLLGAWIDLENKLNILDVGTGTGLIALMMAQRNNNAHIIGIDIDLSAANQAKENVKLSSWKDRVEIKHVGFQDFYLNGNEKFDLLVSNPPFFRNSQKTPKQSRTIARHADLLSVDDFLTGCAKLLKPHGSFGIIFPFNDYDYFRAKALSCNFFETKRMIVYPTPQKPPVRVLSEWASIKPNKLKVEEIIIEKYGRHLYSEKYIDLTKEFYLNM
jgi:tRNA1Val (adenine37-N6)-methyltransferase